MTIDFVALTIGGHYVQLTLHLDDVEPKLFAIGTGVGASTVFRRHELPGARAGSQAVAFSTDRGHFLTALHSVSFVTAGATEIGPEQTFEETWLPDDRVALRTATGGFLCAEDGGGGRVSTRRLTVGAWEKFFYEAVPEGLLPDGFRREQPRLDEARSDRVQQADLSPDPPEPRLGPGPSQRFDPTAPPRWLGR